MALTLPRTDIMSAVGYEDQTFDFIERQEFSRTAGGITIAKDLGPGLWNLSMATAPLFNDIAVDFEAIVRSLSGSIHGFYAGDLRRPYPRAHADGDFSDSNVKVDFIGANTHLIRLKGVPVGLQLSRGDYLCYDVGDSRWLHQVMENTTANGSGVTSIFEIRPAVSPALDENDAVTLKNPTALFILEPGSTSSKRAGPVHSIVSFRAVQSL